MIYNFNNMGYEVLFVVTIEIAALWVEMPCHIPEAHSRNTLGMSELRSFGIELENKSQSWFECWIFFLRFWEFSGDFFWFCTVACRLPNRAESWWLAILEWISLPKNSVLPPELAYLILVYCEKWLVWLHGKNLSSGKNFHPPLKS